MKIEYCDGKYSVEFDEKTGKMTVNRYGEFWQDLTGNGLILAMLQKTHDLETASKSAILDFAIGRWNSEVKDRPLANIHRRSLDDAWRHVIRFAGGDPAALIGPSHDALVEIVASSPGSTLPRRNSLYLTNPEEFSEAFKSLQAGEITVSRAKELLGLLINGQFSDSLLPPAIDIGLGEDETPVMRIKSLEAAVSEQRGQLDKMMKDSLVKKDEIDRLRATLEKLAKLGNGDRYGNSVGNIIARNALDGYSTAGVNDG